MVYINMPTETSSDNENLLSSGSFLTYKGNFSFQSDWSGPIRFEITSGGVLSWYKAYKIIDAPAA